MLKYDLNFWQTNLFVQKCGTFLDSSMHIEYFGNNEESVSSPAQLVDQCLMISVPGWNRLIMHWIVGLNHHLGFPEAITVKVKRLNSFRNHFAVPVWNPSGSDFRAIQRFLKP